MNTESSARPVLSVVIVNSDGADDTLQCIGSIYQHPPREWFEIVLVDNCSRDSCLPMVTHRFPDVRTFSAPMRQGFAKNYNLGIRQSRGQIVMILNNDTLVHANALDQLVNVARSNPMCGIAGPQLVSPNGKIQTVCARDLVSPVRYVLTLLLLDLGLPTGKLWDVWRRRQLTRRASGAVPCISGACMVLSRETLDKVGLLDEGFDFYFEDIEWCHHMQKFGLQVVYVSEAKITHLGDQSLGRVKEWAKRSEYLSALRYFRQYYRWSLGRERVLWFVVLINYFLRMIMFGLLEFLGKRSDNARVYRNLLNWLGRQYPKADCVTA